MHNTIKVIRETIKENVKDKKSFTPAEINSLMPWVLVGAGLVELEEFEDETKENKEESPFSHIEDELDGAEEYLKMYEETKDADFIAMSKDESKHAKKFISEVKIDPKFPKDEEKLNSLIDRYNDITAKYKGLEGKKI